MKFFGILPRLLNKRLQCTIYYKAASIKVVYILKIPPLKLILPRCGLNTIFSKPLQGDKSASAISRGFVGRLRDQILA